MRTLGLTFAIGVLLTLGLTAPAQDVGKKKTAAGKKTKTDPAKKAADSKRNKERASYAIGRQIGEALRRQGMKGIDAAQLARGIVDTLAGKKSAISAKDLQTALNAFQKEMAAQAEAEQLAASAKNEKDGAAYLLANGKKKGVRTTKSGLQYEVLKPGAGGSPKATETVEVHYRGTTIGGNVFDESFKGKVPAITEQPVKFAANRVIKGWTEALQLMKVGSTYRLVIPSELAYGTRGAGADIGPNAVLIFEVHLLRIQK